MGRCTFKNITSSVMLVTPTYGYPVFSSRANIATDGMYHQYLHAVTGDRHNTHLHTGWNPATGAGFFALTDHGRKVTETTRFTTNALTAIGEWQCWTNDAGTYARLGVNTSTDSIVWSSPALLMAKNELLTASLELPGMEGVIAYVPDVTATYTEWQQYVVLPHTVTTTRGPGLILFAWVRSIEICGKIIKRPHSPPRAPGEERFGRQAVNAVDPWIHRPQLICGQSTDRQPSGGH